MSYLINWGDRFTSHQYVPVYWGELAFALKQAFLSLDNSKDTCMARASYDNFQTINGLEVSSFLW